MLELSFAKCNQAQFAGMGGHHSPRVVEGYDANNRITARIGLLAHEEVVRRTLASLEC